MTPLFLVVLLAASPPGEISVKYSSLQITTRACIDETYGALGALLEDAKAPASTAILTDKASAKRLRDLAAWATKRERVIEDADAVYQRCRPGK